MYNVNFGTASIVTRRNLFLKDDQNPKACYSLSSVTELLQSSLFRDKNPGLVQIFRKAKTMMEKGEIGNVTV